MEEENFVRPADSVQYSSTPIMSPEIVEIGEDSTLVTGSRDARADVYVAVGKDDLDVLKWALDHAVSPGARVFLVHVFPPITYIRTPVGRLRRSLLQKYIRLCIDSKVTADTMLLESNDTAKAILELIPVLNITILVLGTKHPPSSRWRWKKLGKGEFIKENAPDCCEVTIVHNGTKVTDGEQVTNLVQASSSPHRVGIIRHWERNFLECACFSVKFS
ncbi:hypothetical protein SLA2020_039950 [Shorea laevis]